MNGVNHNDVLVERGSNGVVRVIMNRPEKLNALNNTMFQEITATFIALSKDPTCRAIILTGAGERAFTAGGDLSQILTGNSDDVAELTKMVARSQESVVAIIEARQPVIAAINGVCVGAGFNIALSCDLIIAGDNATFAQSFVKRGLVPDMGGFYLLPRIVGLHRAKQIMFSGETLDATMGQRLGFVNQIVPASDVLKTAEEWAQRLAAGPAASIAAIKRNLNRSFDATLAESLQLEAEAQAQAIAGAEAREGMTAFLEKRAPNFGAILIEENV